MIIWPQWVSRRGTLDWIVLNIVDLIPRQLGFRKYCPQRTPPVPTLVIIRATAWLVVIFGFVAGFLLSMVLC